jgi:apolipoprotein N-acyltransferase
MNRREIKYILFFAVLLTLSYPPFPLGFLAPIALALFIQFINNSTPRDGFRLGYWLGLIWGSMTLFWIAASTLIGSILAITVNSLHYALLSWIFCWIRDKNRKMVWFVFPVIWVASEYLRLFSDLRFNWLTLAYTQTYYLPLIQIVEITGYLFLSLLIVSLAEMIYFWRQSKQVMNIRWLIPILLPVILLWLYGEIRIRELDNRQLPVLKAGLVQPNVDPYQKWDPEFQEGAFQMLMQDSRKLAALKPDLIVWPETATPFYLRTHLSEIEEIVAFLDTLKIHLLTGTPDYQYNADKSDVFTYNAAFFFRPGNPSFDSYYKMALVPGSETIPFKKYFPVLRKIEVGGGDFFPGDEFTRFSFEVPFRNGNFCDQHYQNTQPIMDSTSRVNLAAIICYESVFPHIVRQFIDKGANVLTIITNDGWFGLTSGPYQHARFAVLRAIENRVSIIRCANTGISGFIDPVGRILTKANLNTHAQLIADIPLGTSKTFYTRHGEWLGQLSLGISGLSLLVIMIFTHLKK